MTIDKGRGLTYRSDYPIPGIDQSSQQFRDNFAIIQGSVEALQRLASSSSSVVALTTSVDNSGNVLSDITFPTTRGLVAPSSATAPVAGSIRYDNANSRLQVYNGSSWTTVQTGGFGNYVATLSGANGIIVTGSGSEGAAVSLTTNAVSTNTASTLVARDSSGNFAANQITATLIGNASTATQASQLTVTRTFSLSGDASGAALFNGSANATINVTLASVTTAGTFSQVVVDAKGRVISGGTAPASAVTLTGDIAGTGTGTISTALANVGTAGTYTQVVTDAKGRVISGTLSGGVGVTLTGDIAGSGTGTIATTLASTGVTAGTYLKVAVDAKGRVTSGLAVTPADIATGSNNSISFGLTGSLVSTINLATSGTTRVSLTTTTLAAATDNAFDIGASGTRFRDVYAVTFRGTATEARYADLAERYAADAAYEPGTVVVFGGKREITASTLPHDRRVAGVISTAPAYMMNCGAGDDVSHPYVALVGRVPCKVFGPVQKGDILVSSDVPGHAMATSQPRHCAVIGKALADFDGPGTGVIEISVQRA